MYRRKRRSASARRNLRLELLEKRFGHMQRRLPRRSGLDHERIRAGYDSDDLGAIHRRREHHAGGELAIHSLRGETREAVQRIARWKCGFEPKEGPDVVRFEPRKPLDQE